MQKKNDRKKNDRTYSALKYEKNIGKATVRFTCVMAIGMFYKKKFYCKIFLKYS